MTGRWRTVRNGGCGARRPLTRGGRGAAVLAAVARRSAGRPSGGRPRHEVVLGTAGQGHAVAGGPDGEVQRPSSRTCSIDGCGSNRTWSVTIRWRRCGSRGHRCMQGRSAVAGHVKLFAAAATLLQGSRYSRRTEVASSF